MGKDSPAKARAEEEETVVTDQVNRPNVTGSTGKVNEINVNDLKNILSKEKRPVIIDVSTPGEFREGHIHGGRGIKMSTISNPGKLTGYARGMN